MTFLNLLNIPTPNKISGIVVVKYIKHPSKLRYKLGWTSFAISSLCLISIWQYMGVLQKKFIFHLEFFQQITSILCCEMTICPLSWLISNFNEMMDETDFTYLEYILNKFLKSSHTQQFIISSKKKIINIKWKK